MHALVQQLVIASRAITAIDAVEDLPPEISPEELGQFSIAINRFLAAPDQSAIEEAILEFIQSVSPLTTNFVAQHPEIGSTSRHLVIPTDLSKERNDEVRAFWAVNGKSIVNSLTPFQSKLIELSRNLSEIQKTHPSKRDAK